MVADAQARASFVRIDMEDSSTTDRTLQLYRELRALGPRRTSGSSCRRYLRRTIDDVAGLENVRLCKGIYLEPPAIAYREFEAVRANFLLVLEKLVAQGSYVGIATHDEYLIAEALRIVARPRRATATSSRCCSACARSAPTSSSRAGHRVRIYVPYGTQWYEYSLRRLQENPKIAGLRRGRHGRPASSPLVLTRTLPRLTRRWQPPLRKRDESVSTLESVSTGAA